MSNVPNNFHFPQNIQLNNKPLAEAWLTIHWKLQETIPNSGIFRDEYYPIALAQFYKGVRRNFSRMTTLDADNLPVDALPHNVRRQFWQGDNKVIQLGPGIATINAMGDGYESWDIFRADILYLRDQLIDAYDEVELQPELISLRYRNAVPCHYSSSNLLDFLHGNLNIAIELPKYIPGAASNSTSPVSINFNMAYALQIPIAKGIIRINTGFKAITGSETQDTYQEEHLIFDTEIISFGEDPVPLRDTQEFIEWLEAAHNVTHEWFFSLVDGDLLGQFQRSGE